VNRYLVRKLHKWVFMFMGVFMLAWLLSGLVMILPPSWFGVLTRFDRSDADYTLAVLSPAQAVALIERQAGTSADVRKVTLRKIDGRILYEIALGNSESRLIDAQSGELFSFTPELAERITRRIFNITAPLLESTRLTDHDSTYPRGQLPVYRVRFSDNPAVAYFMQESNLRIFRSSSLSRVRSAITSLHDLRPFELLTGSDDFRHNLLVATTLVSLVGAFAGLILILPYRNTAKR
jgi:uncharacterized iron-regulated membrane protein